MIDFLLHQAYIWLYMVINQLITISDGFLCVTPTHELHGLAKERCAIANAP